MGKHDQELLTGNLVPWRCFLESLGGGRKKKKKDDDDDDDDNDNYGDDGEQVS
jgi:hypothetical protein